MFLHSFNEPTHFVVVASDSDYRECIYFMASTFVISAIIFGPKGLASAIRKIEGAGDQANKSLRNEDTF